MPRVTGLIGQVAISFGRDRVFYLYNNIDVSSISVDRQEQRRQRDAGRVDRMVQPGRGHTPVVGHAGHGFVKRAALAQRARGHARPGEPVQLVERSAAVEKGILCARFTCPVVLQSSSPPTLFRQSRPSVAYTVRNRKQSRDCRCAITAVTYYTDSRIRLIHQSVYYRGYIIAIRRDLAREHRVVLILLLVFLRSRYYNNNYVVWSIDFIVFPPTRPTNARNNIFIDLADFQDNCIFINIILGILVRVPQNFTTLYFYSILKSKNNNTSIIKLRQKIL